MNTFELGSTVDMTEKLTEWARECNHWVGTTAKVTYVGCDYIILRSNQDGRPFALLFPGGIPQKVEINKFIGETEHGRT